MANVHENICNILLGSTGKAPYLENTSGDILSTFNTAVLGQLIQTDESFNLLPGLISEFEYDFEKKVYILKLSKGLEFHNGRKVTASDLEFALLRGFFSPNSSFYSVYLNNIEGIDKVNPELKFKSGLVSGINVIDDRTLTVKLATPNPSFLHVLTNAYFSLVPIEALEDNYTSWKSKPIGAGPYKVLGNGFEGGKVRLQLNQRDSTTQNSVERIDIYTDPSVSVKFDIVMNPASQVDTSTFESFMMAKPAGVRTIFFSNENKLGQDQNFRLAVQNIIRRDLIANSESYYSETSQILPKHFWGRAESEFKGDEKLARQYLSTIPAALKKEVIEIPIFGSGKVSAAQLRLEAVLKEQFESFGLSIRFIPSAEKFPTLASAKKYPMRITGRVSDYLDPLIMFASLKTGSPYTYDQPSGTIKKRFDDLYEKASEAKTYEDRIETVRALSKFVLKESIAVALSEEKAIYWINPKRVESLGEQPQPLTLFLKNIGLKKR